MKISELRSYIRGVIDAIGPFNEWPDGFNFENIPSTVLDGAYHLQIGQAIGSSANQMAHEFRVPLTVRVFAKGYRSPSDAIDGAIGFGEQIMAAVLAPEVRLNGNGLKDIRPTTLNPIPLAISNDNAVILELVFECFMVYSFNE